jgi:UDP-N-acetylmuramate: L-alanyl-gamma-D-glutamyl-meso-diaminopimelate ligase
LKTKVLANHKSEFKNPIKELSKKMSKRIHMIAACGTGMGTLACALKQMGHTVTGSDINVYPPMSNYLKDNGIPLFQGYDPAHLESSPDLVIIGNAVSRENPEAEAVLSSEIPYMSMPQAINEFIAKDKKVILITGTHGKTTTSALLSHILHVAGMEPSFLIGGILKNFDSGFRIGSGGYMVIEGDEYDTAFFDKGPKFLHYNPDIIILTGIEFDHADIYQDIDHVKSAFTGLLEKNENKSHIIAYEDSKHLMDVLSGFNGSIETYGKNGYWFYSDHIQENSRTYYKINSPQISFPVETGLCGEHNIFNTLACVAAAVKLQITPDNLQTALQNFSGVRRRQEIRGVQKGITVMDDFAHHPTAVKETIRAVKPFYTKGRIFAIFQPGSYTSMRNIFQDTYIDALLEADQVCICEPQFRKNLPDQISVRQLVDAINEKGVSAHYFENTDNLLNMLINNLKENDLALIMSNRGFDDIHEKLLIRLSDSDSDTGKHSESVYNQTKESEEESNLETMEWEVRYSVEIDEIDEQQKIMFQLFNKLIDIKQSESADKDYIDVLNAINENSRLFFNIEEKHLKKRGYPDLSLQIKAHRHFLKHSMCLRREIAENDNSMTYDTIEQLRERLITHILNEDSLYIPFMNLSQYVEDCKKKK